VSAGLSPDLQQVYDAYEPGLSLRDMAKKINAAGGQISHTTVGKLLQRLKDKGVIDARGNNV
jgi:predicted transcriptional regulator